MAWVSRRAWLDSRDQAAVLRRKSAGTATPFLRGAAPPAGSPTGAALGGVDGSYGLLKSMPPELPEVRAAGELA
jgi:hypothetical protein